MHQPLEPPQKQPITKHTPLPHQVRPPRTKPIPAERPNIIEYDEKSTTDLHHNIHKPHRGRHIILLDIPASPPRVFLRNLQGWTQAGQTQT